MKLPEIRKIILTLLSGCLSALCLAAVAQPARANYWGYSPYTGSASWLWLARSLSYPLNRYSGYNAPYYLANSLVWNATYAATQGLDGRRRQATYGQYLDPEPFYNPRSRVRPVANPIWGVDQVAYAQGGPAQIPAVAAPAPVPGSYPGWAPQAVPAGQIPSSSSPPGTAPALSAVGQASAQPPPPVPATSCPQRFNNAPLAQGFIDLVNRKYESNISKALFDPQTRSYARAVGLVDGDAIFDADLSEDRLSLIRTVLLDAREDPLTRVAAVRMLLKH